MRVWFPSAKKWLRTTLRRLSHPFHPVNQPTRKSSQRQASVAAIKVYWWRGSEGFNFGDELSPIMVKAFSGLEVELTPVTQADMLAIGSILQTAARSQQLVTRCTPLHVWGTGIIMPLNFPELNCLEASAIRGPLTRSVLRLRRDVPLGDPGLLSDRIVPRPVAKHYAWGIVPHHSEVQSAFFRRLLESTPRSTLIDVREPDTLATISKIAACERIVSTSLHGLIVADAFHISNLWIGEQRPRHGFKWKFTDYFLSVGRSLFQPVEAPETHNLNDLAETEDTLYFSQIEALKDQIAAAFPVF